MGKVRVHCYGCPATLEVDQRLPDQGLRIARWAASHGETFCPSCAKERGLEDPWGASVPWTDYDHRRRDTGGGVAAARETVPLGPAIEDPRTSSSLRRYGRRGWLWLAAGAATLLATGVFVGTEASHAKQLLRAGLRTPGLVESYRWLREGGEIRVRYVANGGVREGTIYVKERPEPGERVEVIYDPSDPSRIRTPEDSNQSPLATRAIVYGFIFGSMIFIAGVIVLARPRRWRRLLQAPWQAYSATYIPGQGRRSGPGLRVSPLDAAGEDSTLRLGATLRGRAAKLASEPVVWAAGDPGARVVVATPGTRELFAAERPRGYLGRKWLEAQKGPTARERRAWGAYWVLIGAVSAVLAVMLASQQQWLGALIVGASAAVFLWLRMRTLRRRSTAAGGAPLQQSADGPG